MIEQQIQRQSEVMTPTMQQQNLLLSPALLRHRRHSIPSAAVVGTGGEQDRSSEASTETHIEDRVGDMDERISLELQQSMMEPPTKYKYLMESSAEEHYGHILQEDSLIQATTLQSEEENSTEKAEGQGWKSTADSYQDNIPIDQINEDTNQQNSISLPKASDLLPESSSTDGCGLSTIAAATRPENGTPLHLDHSEAAEIFQLMQRLKEDDGIGVSPGDYAYDNAGTAEHSEEDSEGDRDILEGQSEKDSVEYQNLSNDVSSKADEKLMRPSHDKPIAPLLLSHDDYWWPSPTSIEKKKASDGHKKDKLPCSAKRLKLDPKASCFPTISSFSSL